ncbi:MAG: GNAT family N-acetyltransferase [Chloroflexi bacterium]|nr:GNAT family N-acetyltransferase [Chloroflexota bacterium]
MEAVGWHPLVGDDDLLTEFERRVRVQLANPKILVLLAETDAGICGLLEAELIELSGIFQPRRGIHISAVYVEEAMRHQGIARRLIDRAFDWARAQGGTFAQLSVLAANPARHLYESIGFTVFEQEMTLPLR